MKISALIFLLISYSVVAYERFEMVAMAQLIANPEKYIGKKVQVKGYFYSGISTDLYLSRENAVAMDFMSSVSVEDRSKGKLSISKCNSGWVDIAAIFSYKNGSFMLRDVQFIRSVNGISCELE